MIVESDLEYQVWRDVKLPAGKILIPGVVSHATDLIEHSELVADRLIAFPENVGRENSTPQDGLRHSPLQNQLTLIWASVLPQLSLLAQGAFIMALSVVVMRPWV